mgnify:FL=1
MRTLWSYKDDGYILINTVENQRKSIMDIIGIFLECVNRWADGEIDDRIEDAMDKFENWIDDLDQKELYILSKLLKNYNYHSRKDSFEIVTNLAEKTMEEFNINNDNTIISPVRKSDGKINSSYEYWLIHRNVSGLSKNIYYDSLDGILDEEWDNIENVVYIDDCSGTGHQFVKFLERQNKSFQGKRIIFIVIEIMEDAIQFIKNYSHKTGIQIQIRSKVVAGKAFKNSSDEEKNIFTAMSRKRKIRDNYIMGYKDAEALMTFYNNTPNDTLGIFWFPIDDKKPIFSREMDIQPGWKRSRDEKNTRRRERYESKFRGA